VLTAIAGEGWALPLEVYTHFMGVEMNIVPFKQVSIEEPALE